MHINVIVTVFTAWGYHLSLLELLAFITSVIGIELGVFGPRATWPWWHINSLLSAGLFYEEKYFASVALQFILIAGGLWGWFEWGPKGAKPAKLTKKERARWSVIFVISWGSLYPILKKIGAAASLTDAFGFVGSGIAQILMVMEKYECSPLWFVVNAVCTYQFWHGGSYLAAILYFIFVLLAVARWKTWLRESSK